MDSNDLRERLLPWWPEIAVAALVLVLALPALASAAVYGTGVGNFLALCLVGASAIAFRRAPGIALGLIWLALLTHLLALLVLGYGSPHTAEAVVAVTAFGTARYGSRAVLVLSGLSIPIVTIIAFLSSAFLSFGISPVAFAANFAEPFSVVNMGTFSPLAMSFVLILLLGIPWLLGLVLRSQDSAATSERAAVVARTGENQAQAEREQADVERGQAQQIADLRAEQTRMAREVHDVVGHSLAVILAQAESAQFIPEANTEEHRRVLANVAITARQSLQDVRAVLGATRDGAPVSAQSTSGLDSLIDGIRSAGYEVESSVVGIPRPLPPERDAIAFRVLQEMLTNALKHGVREAAIAVERHWDGDLRIEVRNYCVDSSLTQTLANDGSDQDPAQSSDGTGVEGMQRRLESVGGRLDVRRRDAVDGSKRQTFTATAWLPLES